MSVAADSLAPVAIPSAIEPPSLPAAVVVADRLRVVFEKLLAVNDVSFRLNPGDLLGLIGPNGAGKTTLLRALCGLQPLNGGTIHLLGEELTDRSSDLLAQVGFTPDTPAVYNELTVRQFLRFIGKGYGLSAADVDDRIDFWLTKVWLTEKADIKIKTLSRGMKQRVGIARTLLPNPAIILLDEPAAGLDPAGRVQFRQLLCDLRDQGKALIVSSHILSDMAEYCTHVGIMAAGRLVAVGTVAEITTMHAGSDRCRYTIKLARPVPVLQPLLEAIANVSNVTVERTSVTLEYHSAPEAAVELLAALVAQKLPIAGFSANIADLEEAYLRVGIGQVD